MIILDFENWNNPGVKNNKLAIGEFANMILFVIEGEVVEIIGVNQIIVDEKMYSILLSDPQIIKGDESIHRHIQKVGLNWLYQDGQFIIPGVYE